MKSVIEHGLLAFGSVILLTGSVHGVPRTWDGGGLDGFFSNVVNWDGNATTPVSSTDTLQIGANTVGGVPFIGFDNGEFRTPSLTFLPAAVSPYTVTANSASDFLTLTGTGVALLNQSPVRQNFSLITTALGAATQTWDGGPQGFSLAQIDLGANRVLTVDGTGTTATTRNEIKGGISGTGTSGLTKAGSGTLVLDNPGIESDYPGLTTLIGGILRLARPNQVPNNSKVVLNTGTIFDTGGFSDIVGALSLGGSATIDFGTTNTVSLLFGDSHLELWTAGTLNIVNFTGGADSLRFGTTSSALTPAQLAQISFEGTQAIISSTGHVSPVPEPGVSAILLSGLGILGFCRRHRSRGATA